ncbi:MAG: DUF3500 domain-containing protein [Actinomycetota bacterium]
MPDHHDAEDRNRTVATTMAEAAESLLAALDGEQRARATFGFDDAERRLWFYTPTNHGGLPLVDMDVMQHRLVWRLLATGLSVAGYNTTAVIVGQDNILDRIEGFQVDFDRDRGRDPMAYWVAVFGQPGSVGRWGWRFGGHHVSVHFTVVDGAVVSATPCFLGSDPASAPLLGPHLHRPLGGVEDLGRELARSLDGEQAAAAIVSAAAPSDIVTVNRTTLVDGDNVLGLPYVWRGRFEAAIDQLMARMQADLERSLGGTTDELEALAFSTRPKGLAAASMRSDQRELLRELLFTYVGRIHDDLADAQMAQLDGRFEDLHFLWAGSLDPMHPHYYRVQGGDLFVEYDNAARGGNHVHTVWRDLSVDFGGDPLAAHYVGAPRSHGHSH